jgi:hypothetical protein
MTNQKPSKVDIYSAIVDFMKIGCNHSTCQKLDTLKNKIKQGYNSPSTESLNIFGENLFVFSFETYEYIYNTLNGELS